MKKVLGMGAALVDVLAHVNDSWIDAQNVQKGGMNMVDNAQMMHMLSTIKDSLQVPGGSTCNTMVGLSKLGGRASFISKVGDDNLGKLFIEHLSKSNVESKVKIANANTGCVLSAVTPDAERTMWTYLGASDFLSSKDFELALYDDVGLLYAEGYRAFNAECFKKSFALAKYLGVKTALDFSSFGVVDACRKTFDNLFEQNMIDIVIANEDEAFAYTQKKEEEALEILSKKTEIAIVKLGKRGALIAKGANICHIDAGSAKAIDTTGAGDLWAAGFLYGYMNNWNIENSGKLGSIVSNEVVQVMGAQIPDSAWEKIRLLMKNLI